ncbi:MAG: hypothetical protein N5P05_003928 [Chroococcopsis gigantea SAG 12.99]|jgi:hypothetical protein|nr:hypothetical protein [Chroococcopsis gigantea SAG 12.99]
MFGVGGEECLLPEIFGDIEAGETGFRAKIPKEIYIISLWRAYSIREGVD